MAELERPGILFLCVANSSRSQMAEGFARQMAPAGIEIYSAGSAPTRPHPLAVEVMKEVGIELALQRSKSVDSIDKARIGTVVTLCAEEICPVFAGEVTRYHWPFEDPAAVNGTDDEQLDGFRRVRDQIRDRLEAYFRESA